MSAWPAGTETVVGCRGPYCGWAAEAVTPLAHGVPAARPDDGSSGQAVSCLATAPRTVPSNERKETRPASPRATCSRYLPASASDGASALFGSCPFQLPTHASFGVEPITKSSVPPAFISSYVMYGRCSGVPFRLTDWT
ncbi:ArsR family transcriptional regulator [Burkholderia cenocepacia]|uniref:ArsR family transcriptional regulator n=1 Tax=Burkholderia cenocepacia TaxID=95486 RepID=A0A6J5JV77_9BURK|nr:ArsR family transcriptional regulator [Burkholderia cenocepacia]